MELTTYCQSCHSPLFAFTGDMSEGDAQTLSGRLYCVRCAVRRLNRESPLDEAIGAARGTVDVLPTPPLQGIFLRGRKPSRFGVVP